MGAGSPCTRCKGCGHVPKDCPNLVSAKSPAWIGRHRDQQAKPCSLCSGIGHWREYYGQFIKALEAGNALNQTIL